MLSLLKGAEANAAIRWRKNLGSRTRNPLDDIAVNAVTL
jgi:hypothetical protein